MSYKALWDPEVAAKEKRQQKLADQELQQIMRSLMLYGNVYRDSQTGRMIDPRDISININTEEDSI